MHATFSVVSGQLVTASLRGGLFDIGIWVSATAVPELASLQEGHYRLVVEGCIFPMHRVPCLRHHYLRFPLEAAFEFGGGEKEQRITEPFASNPATKLRQR